MDENHFAHLEGIVHPDKYEILTSMTHDDKLHIMGELVTKMDIDGDEDIGTSELSTWIHYVEQARYVSCHQKSIKVVMSPILDYIRRFTNNFHYSIQIEMNLYQWKNIISEHTILYTTRNIKIVSLKKILIMWKHLIKEISEDF